ncbi:MAG: amino acid ABC transporter permease [Nakamurella sp.]
MSIIDKPEVTGRGLPIKAIPVRHPGRWVAVAVLMVFAAMIVNSFITNPKWRWDTFSQYVFTRIIFEGLWKTVWITAASMVIGIVLGIILAVMRMSPNPVVKTVAWLYIWFFRGTPVLVQLVFWAFLAQLYRYISLGIPFGPQFIYFDVNELIPVIVAAVLALGLNEAAYMAEIVRSGIMSVGKGQTEAAEALGMRSNKVMRRIVLPQAMRIIVPPTGNEVISMLKTTSLLAFVAVTELFTTAQNIYNSNYQQIPLLVVASAWYLVVTTILSVGQFYLERHFGRGVAGSRQQRAKRRIATMGPA